MSALPNNADTQIHWLFSEASGTAIADSSGYARNATDAVSSDIATGFNDKSRYVNKNTIATYGKQITSPHDPTILAALQGVWTLDLSITLAGVEPGYSNALIQYGSGAGIWASTGDNCQMWIGVTTPSPLEQTSGYCQLDVLWQNNVGGFIGLSLPNTLLMAIPNLVTIVKQTDGANYDILCYVNGAFVGSLLAIANAQGGSNASTMWTIGSDSNNASPIGAVWMDEVRLSNTVHTPAQILSDYQTWLVRDSSSSTSSLPATNPTDTLPATQGSPSKWGADSPTTSLPRVASLSTHDTQLEIIFDQPIMSQTGIVPVSGTSKYTVGTPTQDTADGVLVPITVAVSPPPTITGVTGSVGQVVITFDSAVSLAAGANAPALWSLTPQGGAHAVTVTAVSCVGTQVTLTTTEQTQGGTYTVVVPEGVVLTSSGTANLADSSHTIIGSGVTPLIATAYPLGSIAVIVVFSEAVDPVSATTPSNYVFSPSLSVLFVTQITPTMFRLTTSSQEPNTTYTLTISNVTDLAGNPI